MDLSETQPPDDNDGCWLPVSPGNDSAVSKKQAQAWALVLDSRSIPCSIEDAPDGQWHLLVPELHHDTALRELQLFEQANLNWPPPIPAARQLVENTLPTVCILILLATFYNLTLLGLELPNYGTLDLNASGVAHAESIMNGELWRCITALTLHGSLVHLLGNLTIGGVFIILLCSEFGSGLAWSLLLASGATGNLINAWAQSPAHRSVGASTLVFAAVGMLAAISTLRYRNQLRKRWFVPVAAGLALLAVLGSEGAQTDLGAHLFGFMTGLLLGLPAEILVNKAGRPGGLLNFLLVVLSGSLVAAAWWWALTAGR